MMRDEFTNHWTNTGYSKEEALEKKRKVDEAHGVSEPNTKWRPAEIVQDLRGGYKVVIETIA